MKLSCIFVKNKRVMKQETLKDASNNYVNYCAANMSEDEDLADADKRGFIYGAKCQQERSYSEEEVLELLLNCPGPYLTDNEIKEWFEQFKEK
jgi:hypothetical protein